MELAEDLLEASGASIDRERVRALRECRTGESNDKGND
jgi:hypothetical protein